MNHLFVRISMALAVAATANAKYFKTVDEAHNIGEERRSFDLIMKPYPIPAETTTYVDFMFNLPDDLPDVFHVTYGEVINSQPEHLHHFALLGCPEEVSAEEENVAIDSDLMRIDCMSVLGGWAPGADIFGNTDLDTGFLMGRGLGIKSLRLNAHYTDGVYVDEAETILKMATDGIRIHYTPVFRPFSSVSKQLINVVTAPRQLQIPPGEKRFFLSRQCEVDTNCKDANADTLSMIAGFLGFGQSDMEQALGGAALTCETMKPLCGLGGTEGSYIKRLCPESCGLCEPGADGNPNPFDPEAYRVTAVWYHAHLLGREMYTTLIRGDDALDDASTNQEDSIAITPKQAPLVQDLQSREFWIFDNQETIPLEFDVVQNDTILRGTEVRPGDKIQTTCVFDSTYRDEPTNFYLSTYDEMCANDIRVTFATPAKLMDGDADAAAAAALDLATELHLLSFACKNGPQADVYAGTLTPDEDGRDIWKDHPVEDAEGCTFITSDFLFGALTEETRNCDVTDLYANNLICDEGVEFLPDVEAGARCTGGTRDDEDSNTGLTETDCITGGGTWYAYSCAEADNWVAFEATLDPAMKNMLVNDWWNPKCCAGDGEAVDEVAADVLEEVEESEDGEEESEDGEEESEDGEDESSSSSSSSSNVSSAVVLRRGAVVASASVVLVALLWG